jgi:hypothetical protein
VAPLPALSGPGSPPVFTPPRYYTATVNEVSLYQSPNYGPPIPLDTNFAVYVADNAKYPASSPVQIIDPVLSNNIVGATKTQPLVVPLNATGSSIVLERDPAAGTQIGVWLSIDAVRSNATLDQRIAIQVDFAITFS